MLLPASNQILKPAILHQQDFCTFSFMINHHWLCIQLMNVPLLHIPSFLLRHYLSQVHLFQLSTTQIRVVSHILNTQGVYQAFILNSGLQAIWMSMFIPAAKSSSSYCVTWWERLLFGYMQSYVCCNVPLLRHKYLTQQNLNLKFSPTNWSGSKSPDWNNSIITQTEM